jgi:cytochrome b
MQGDQYGAAADTEVKVWDPLVRIFHWSLVLSFTVAFISAEEWDDLHIWAGYMAAGLIAFRLVWGLFGPRHARFISFVTSPGNVVAYAKQILTGDAPRYLGHNPLGGAMILALILSLAVVSVTGWMFTLDRFWGVEWVEAVHATFANMMVGLVALHVCGVLISSLSHKENLVRAMVTGRKRAPSPSDINA